MEPDVLLTNGRIYTGTGFDRTASSVSVLSGRIAEIGEVSRGPKTEIIDLGGRTVIPAFIDSHTHFCSYGLSLSSINLDGVAPIEEALERIRRFVEGKKPGEWIRGLGWDQNLWGRWPNRQELDRVAPLNPVVLTRKDVHLLWVNTLAIDAVGWNASTPNPEGGQIDRDRTTGELTGVIRERAMEMFRDRIPPPSREEWIESIRVATSNFHRFGITSAHTMEGPDEFKTLAYLNQTEGLGIRFHTLIARNSLDEFVSNGIRTGFGDEFLRVGPLKIFLDGTLGSQTAEMLRPFEGTDNFGITYTNDDELESLVDRATSSGVSVAMHAIGDKAVRRAIDHFERLPASHLRHRIEHVQLIDPADLERVGKLDLIASVQPIHLSSDVRIAHEHWGDRSRWAYAFKSLRKHGMKLAFGSDCPVESPAVIPSIKVARNRQSLDGEDFFTEEALPIREVLQAFTIGGAYASGEEAIKGSIDIGKLADMIVLSEDPLDTSNVGNIEVLRTLFAGKTVYSEESGQ